MSEYEQVSFDAEGVRCVGRLYRAKGVEGRTPVVVLAHGFAGTMEGRLGAFAGCFADAGITSLVFDYRHFGESDGEPRQLLSIKRQHQDWRAAIAFARSLDGVDPHRLALWGTSYSGGHVVTLAAERNDIAAVIAQAPFADGLATLKAAGPVNAAKLTAAGIRDLASAAVGGEPHWIPAVAEPGEAAAMSQPGAKSGYLSLFDNPDDFDNRVTARSGLEIGAYSPLRKAKRVSCPLLVLTCGRDAVTPPGPARKMAERAPEGRLIEYRDREHFEIYTGEVFEQTVADQIEFLQLQLQH